MTLDEAMRQIDEALSHVWMVRTFIKHSDEADDEDLSEVHRTLYDYMHALGPAWKAQDAAAYVRQARKKLRRLREATDLFVEVQPEVSTHTNFAMARRSLVAAFRRVEQILDEAPQ